MSGPELPELHSAKLLLALLERKVQFVVVGGIGAQLHGATRTTKDLDVCVAWSRENFERLVAALNDLDALLDLPPELDDLEVRPSSEMLARTSMTRWVTRAGVVDVLDSIPAGEDGAARTFGDLKSAAARVRAADDTVLVAALKDIIASKEHADRAKDRDALPELYELQAQNRER